MTEYMSEHVPGPKSDHMPQHMSGFTAGKMPNHMQARTSEHGPEHVPAFMIDDVSEHKPRLMPEQAHERCVNPHVRLCQASLSIHVPCLLPNRLSGLGSIEVESCVLGAEPTTRSTGFQRCPRAGSANEGLGVRTVRLCRRSSKAASGRWSRALESVRVSRMRLNQFV